MHTLAEILRQLRVRRGLSQDALADAANVSGAAIRALEGGQRARMYGSTARGLTNALRRYASFTDEETRLWCGVTGLDPRVVDGPQEPVNAAAGTIPADLASAVARLIQSTSADYVRGAIEGLYFAHIRGQLAGSSLPSEPPTAIPRPVIAPDGVKIYAPPHPPTSTPTPAKGSKPTPRTRPAM